MPRIETKPVKLGHYQLQPLFDAVTDAHNKSTDKHNLRCSIHGQAFERDGGYAEFRLFDYEQTEIVKTAILEALEIDKEKAAQSRLIEIKKQMASLAHEQSEINARLKTKQTKKARSSH